MLCLLGVRFGLTLRSLQGFAHSILKLMGQDLEVPYFTTFSKRMGSLDVELLEKAKMSGKIHLAIDSTGLKIFGEGEWKMRTHGKQKRRTWRKLHLGVDTKDNSILTAVLTTNDFKDSELFEDLLGQVEGVESVFGDGGYDSSTLRLWKGRRNKNSDSASKRWKNQQKEFLRTTGRYPQGNSGKRQEKMEKRQWLPPAVPF
jgi:hypothetical protein